MAIECQGGFCIQIFLTLLPFLSLVLRVYDFDSPPHHFFSAIHSFGLFIFLIHKLMNYEMPLPSLLSFHSSIISILILAHGFVLPSQRNDSHGTGQEVYSYFTFGFLLFFYHKFDCYSEFCHIDFYIFAPSVPISLSLIFPCI